MAIITVSSGETLSGLNASTAVYVGGTSGGTSVTLTGNTISVVSGGSATSLTVSSGVSVVASGGAVTNTTVISGGIITTSGGATTSGITASSGGSIVINSGSTNTADRVVAGGVMILNSNNSFTTYNNMVADVGGLVELVATGNYSMSALSGTSIFAAQVTTNTNTAETSGGVLTTSNITANRTSVTILNGFQTFTSSVATLFGLSNRVLFTITCFAAGTHILTADGERVIEAIQPGDMVTVLRDGQPVQEAVTWVGSSRIDLSRHAHPELAAPIRVMAGALAQNVPARDMLLSPEHCLVLNDRCVPVKLLVNGATIVREFPAEPFTYYHIELEKHGILLAEGAQSESYLDTGNRASFDNADAPKLLHPTFDVNPTSDRWKTDACAPLASVPDEVAPIWQTLAQRAADLGMTIPTPKLIENPDVHLIVDGKRLQPTSDRSNRFVFMVPAGATSVALASRFCIPADKMVPGVRDTRRLDVSVDWMAIRTTTAETILAADHPGLTSGWNDAETDGATTWRWTDGSAVIPWDGIEGSAVLTVRCAPVAEYPVYDEKLRLVA